MVSRIRYYRSAALALLLAGDVLVNAEVYVCGADYNDAAANCILNTECPLGDGCLTDTTCFAIPEGECVGFISLPPTLAPTKPDLYVCGISFEDALSRCRSEEDACTNVTDTSAYCAGAVTASALLPSCFVVPHESCPTDAPSSSPMWPTWTSSPAVETLTATTTSPTVVALTATTTSPTLVAPTATTTSPTLAAPTATTTSPTLVAPTATTTSPTVGVLLESSFPSSAAVTTISPTTLTASLPPTSLGSKAPTVLTTSPTTTASMEPTTVAEAGAESPIAMSVAPTTSSPPVLLGSMAPTAHTETLTATSTGPASLTPTSMEPTAVAEAETDSPIATSVAPTTTSLSPTVSLGSTALAVATDSPTPATLFVCGDDYSDALNNICGLTPCPNGDGCGEDLTCFAVPYTVCTPTMSPSPTNQITFTPTMAPSYNTFFCGETYEIAAANCWTADPCPSGTCSNTGEQCYGISAERCLSPAPTGAPTVAGTEPTTSPTSSLPTPATASPSTSSEDTVEVVNTDFFCGMYYDDAMSSCSQATSCPSGVGCPTGMSCFAGISCAALLPPTTASPLTPPPVPLTQRYCGASLEDATSLCATKTSCHDGNTQVCPFGETCFDIEEPCGIVESASSVAANVPSLSPIAHVFDPDNRFYCGDSYEDAVMNCTDRLACPNGALDECPTGQTCYPIVTCEPPQSVVLMNAGSGMDPSRFSDTQSDEAETVAFEAGQSNGSHTVKILLAKYMFWGGTTLVVFILF